MERAFGPSWRFLVERRKGEWRGGDAPNTPVIDQEPCNIKMVAPSLSMLMHNSALRAVLCSPSSSCCSCCRITKFILKWSDYNLVEVRQQQQQQQQQKQKQQQQLSTEEERAGK